MTADSILDPALSKPVYKQSAQAESSVRLGGNRSTFSVLALTAHNNADLTASGNNLFRHKRVDDDNNDDAKVHLTTTSKLLSLLNDSKRCRVAPTTSIRTPA